MPPAGAEDMGIAGGRRWDWGRVASLTCWLARRRRGEAGGFGWREQGGWSVRRSSIYGGGPPRSAAAVLLESHLAAAASQPVGALLPSPDWPRCSGTTKEARGRRGGRRTRGAAGEIDEAGERLERLGI